MSSSSLSTVLPLPLFHLHYLSPYSCSIALFTLFMTFFIELVTNEVLKVLCSEQFGKSALRWTSEEAKETAKTWTEGMSCPAWCNGWLMVDGTLVPFFKHPTSYGSYLSLDLTQIVSTPDL